MKIDENKPNLAAPPEDIPFDVWLTNLLQTAEQTLPIARQTALLRLIWQEPHLTREGLIARVEAVLGRECFGSSPRSTFYRDITAVRRALAEAGYQLVYSRRSGRQGYFVEGRLVLDEQLRHLIAGAVAEVDPVQIAISRRLTPAQQFEQGFSMTRLAEQVLTYRRRQRQVSTSAKETDHLIREKEVSEMTEPSMDFGDFMRLVLDALEAAGVEYMIGGAVAVWAWGEARTTRDFDLVVNIPFDNIVNLSQELEKRDMLVPAEIILDLLTKQEGDLPINAIHLYTGYKAELFLLRQGDTHRAIALARRRLADFGPPLGEVYVHAPEDLILFKLHYFTVSQQPKHVRDITSIVLALEDELDTAYLESWAVRLGLIEQWREILREIPSS